jgi:hypothetical protein
MRIPFFDAMEQKRHPDYPDSKRQISEAAFDYPNRIDLSKKLDLIGFRADSIRKRGKACKIGIVCHGDVGYELRKNPG